jgi:hypothetical protein
MSDRASEALEEGFLLGEPQTYNALSSVKMVSLSTLHYHRANGRRSKEQKAQSQQCLTPLEEKALTGIPKVLKQYNLA